MELYNSEWKTGHLGNMPINKKLLGPLHKGKAETEHACSVWFHGFRKKEEVNLMGMA